MPSVIGPHVGSFPDGPKRRSARQRERDREVARVSLTAATKMREAGVPEEDIVEVLVMSGLPEAMARDPRTLAGTSMPPEEIAPYLTRILTATALTSDMVTSRASSDAPSWVGVWNALNRTQVQCLDLLMRMYGMDKRRVPASSDSLANEAVIREMLGQMKKKRSGRAYVRI